MQIKVRIHYPRTPYSSYIPPVETMKWWKKEKKGAPIAVATPVYPGAVAVGPTLVEKPAPSAPIAPSTNYVPAPAYAAPVSNYPQGTVAHGQYMQQPHYDNTWDGQLFRAMGNRTTEHKIFLLFNFVVGLVGCNNFMAQAVALIYFPDSTSMEIPLRLYLLGFCALVVMNESERFPPLEQSYILNNWICRGVFYTFLGVLGENLYDVGADNRYRNNRYRNNSYSSSNENYGWFSRSGDKYGYYGPRMPSKEDFAEWYIWMTSFLMFIAGVLYVIMGCLCLQQRLMRLRQNYQIQSLPTTT